MSRLPKVCYLCGKELSEPIDWDHVPPRQLYAKSIRKAHSPNLLTIPVHASCNKSYQHDEDYFVNSLAPFGLGSYAGQPVLDQSLAKFRTGAAALLIRKVLREFEPNPSGLILPGGKVVKRFDGNRIARVVKKIVAGLYFHHYGAVLPQNVPNGIQMYGPDERPPIGVLDFIQKLNLPRHGQYPGVFDYCFKTFPDVNDAHGWAMLLWDRIIIFVIFHDPACSCARCIKLTAKD